MGFLASYIMRGRWQAIFATIGLAFLSLFMLPISIVSSAAVGLVTLRLGAYEGLTVFGIALAVFGIILLALNVPSITLGYCLLWLPTWFVATLLQTSRKLTLAIEGAIFLGFVGIIGCYLFNPDLIEMWKNLLMQMIPPDVSLKSEQISFLEKAAHYMTGVFASIAVLFWILALFLARWWQANLYNPGGFRSEYLNLATSKRLALSSLFLVGLAKLSSGFIAEIAGNLGVLVLVLYTLVGTAVLHSLLALLKNGRYLVIGFYITLLIPHPLNPYLSVLVAIIGVADAWLNLRQRFKTK